MADPEINCCNVCGATDIPLNDLGATFGNVSSHIGNSPSTRKPCGGSVYIYTHVQPEHLAPGGPADTSDPQSEQ